MRAIPNKLLIALLCISSKLVAQEQPINPKIQTLIITKGDLRLEDHLNLQGVFSDVFSESETVALGDEFLGQPISKEILNTFRETILTKLQQEGEFALTASFPEQDVSSGTVVLYIEQPQIQQVDVKGNNWESKEFYQNKVHVSAGEPLDTDQLLNQVAWFNRNPFRYMEVVIAPGSNRNSVDVDLLVKDRFSLRPFFGSDNTGTNLTDQVRIFTGANWGKPFGRADLMTYQFTTAPDPHDFYAHTGSYLLFLPWKDELTFYGGYSQSHPDVPGFSQEGRSVQASFRYAMPTKPFYEPRKRTFTWGFDYKNINSNVFFAATEEVVVAHQVNISQFFFSYQWEREFMIKGELLISPFRWLPHQSPERYHMLRPHSSVRYMYARLAMGETLKLPQKFSFSWLVRGQVATGPLLPSEQYGLGGYDTVRGYQERDYLADDAFCANAEFRAPTLSLFKKKDELIFLAFSDFAWGFNYKNEVAGQAAEYLWSTGLGARYQVGPYFSIRADYGFQLHHIFNQNAFGRFHLGGYLSY